jgi:hypothetical protein
VATDTSSVSYYDAANSTWYTPANAGGGVPALLRTTSGNGGSSPASAGPINTLGSDLIIIGTNSASPSDSAGNTWSLLTASGNGTRFFYCVNPTTSAAHTFSCPQYAAYFQVAVFVNANGANNISASGNASAGPANTIVANELVVAVVGWANGSGVTGCTMAGFTLASGTLDSSTLYGAFLFYTVKSSPGSITATPLFTPGNPGALGVAMGSFLP